MRKRQSGFTLVEIAVVLVVIGLLLGGVLKGQELIASARVRNLADQQAGIQSAYYGFQDRYRAVAGDMRSDAATDAIGQDINKPDTGTSNGHLEDPGTAGNWDELNGAWEQLSKAGFIQGSYDGGTGSAPTAGNTDVSPVNVYSSPLVLAFAEADKFVNGSSQRLVLFMGQNVPVDIARELDVKLDDGKPESGTLRNATAASDPDVYQSGEGCIGTDDDPSANEWHIGNNAQNCNPVYLF